MKTDNFFVIHNYNTIPLNLVEYCRDYIIYDASDQPGVREQLKKAGLKYIPVKNTGHNITSYFSYFDTEYEHLPEVICLCKGNMIGRHCSKEYFDKVYNNTYFTYLYEDKPKWPGLTKAVQEGIKEEELAFLVSESQYVEKNTSWYVGSPNHPHWYFDNFDDLLTFIYKDPVIPKWCLFSPGACYIVRREQVQKHSPVFYRNLCKIMNYDLDPNFPSEAHQIERMLPLIFEASYEENEWMDNEELFEEKLAERKEFLKKKEEWNKKRLKRIRKLFGQKGY